LPVSKHVQSVAPPQSAGASGQAQAKLTAPAATRDEGPDAGDQLDIHREAEATQADKLLAIDSPALWAIVSIIAIGLFNLMGPKHTGAFALAAAVGMVLITVLISAFAIPQVSWRQLPHYLGHVHHGYKDLWIAFVSIVLALSGVEAIANLTGVMHKPVAKTARKAIFIVAAEVAIFNLLMAAVMLNIHPLNRNAHQEDMLAFLAGYYVGGWGELGVRILGGILLLSATNTAITDMISIQYLMARDGELPTALAALNRFGVPWLPALLAASVPVLVLLFSHDLDSLAALYAIGVIGAVAINVTLCSIHPRLRRLGRKVPMLTLGLILLAMWITLAVTKLHAVVFVTIVMAVGLSARAVTKWLQNRRGVRPSLLRQAIAEQLTADALAQPKVLLGTYGSDALAPAALRYARQSHSTLIVCFVREVTLSYKYESRRLNIDNDLAAVRTFSRILDAAHQMGVPILPVYDTGSNAAEVLAETAAIYGCQSILIGTSRQGALYH
jgi:amino acid transporter